MERGPKFSKLNNENKKYDKKMKEKGTKTNKTKKKKGNELVYLRKIQSNVSSGLKSGNRRKSLIIEWKSDREDTRNV